MTQADHPTPTQILRHEHEVILRVLSAFERMLKSAESGAAPDRQAVSKAVEFFRGFADGCHHAKEEDCLFPALERAGLPTQGGPVGIMLEEHEQGRAYIREIARGNEEDTPEARKRLVDHGWGYVQLLRAHILKENEILFPLAEKSLPQSAMESVYGEFMAVEANREGESHDHFLALAEELEANAGVLGRDRNR